METYDVAYITKKLSSSTVSLIDVKTLGILLDIDNERNLYNMLTKLTESQWLIKIERNKYKIGNRKIHDFEMANFLYQPSYISFESALNYWGVLSQFPFEITSATLKKSKVKKLDDKVFGYNRVSKKYFGGFVKENGFLIASSEKALVDQIYLWSKGLKQLNWDEYDLSRVNMRMIKKMVTEMKLNKKLENYIGKGKI
jgi:predicted transcriptional regulator of viral defense system